MSSCFKNEFMEEALKQAELALSMNEVPVGAIIVNYKTGKIVARAHNLVEKNKSVTAHAEILAMSEAAHLYKCKYLDMCDLYVTLEPCIHCMSAISMYRIRRIYYGASDVKFGAFSTSNYFVNSVNSLYKPEIYSDIYSKESEKLMVRFFKNLRAKCSSANAL